MIVISIYILSLFVLQFLPWWGIAFFAGILGFYYSKIKHVVFSNTVLGFVSWGCPFIYHYFFDGKIIINRMSGMLTLESPLLLFIFTVLIVTSISIFSGLTCFYFKKIAGILNE